MIIILKKSAKEVWETFKSYHLRLTPYRDASMSSCSYNCTIEHCLKGLDLAIKLGWYDFKTFDIVKYQHYERIDCGDLNWTLPGKFISFSGPLNITDRFGSFTVDKYIPVFQKLGVKMVIRLNKSEYDKKKFTKNDIKHLDLYFLDGSTPPDYIVD